MVDRPGYNPDCRVQSDLRVSDQHGATGFNYASGSESWSLDMEHATV